MPSVLSSPVGGFQPTKSSPIRGVITMLPALSPTQAVSRSDGRRSVNPDCRIQWHRYRASPPFTSRTSVSWTQETQRSLSMLGSAVSSSTPSDFQPSSHMGVLACPVMNRHAPPGLPWGCPYPAVGIHRASESAIGLPRRSTSASWMLLFLMPADVRSSFIEYLVREGGSSTRYSGRAANALDHRRGIDAHPPAALRFAPRQQAPQARPPASPLADPQSPWRSVMADTTCHMSISLDGFVAGPDQSREDPLGKRGRELHAWHLGDERANDAAATATGWLMRPRGAYVMGRNMFGPIRDEWDEDWRGWWGPEPPYHAPVFVLTHHPHAPIEMEGGTTFHFVTDGFDAAYAQARETAGEGGVDIAGGASAVRQAFIAGVVDELTLDVAAVLLGSGERIFDGVESFGLEPVEVLHSPLATHIRYCRAG